MKSHPKVAASEEGEGQWGWQNFVLTMVFELEFEPGPSRCAGAASRPRRGRGLEGRQDRDRDGVTSSGFPPVRTEKTMPLMEEQGVL